MRRRDEHSRWFLAPWVLVAVLAVAACDPGAASITDASTTAASTSAAEPTPQGNRAMESAPNPGTAIVCEQRFQPPGGGALALTGHFRAQVAGSEPTLSGTIGVTASEKLKGVTQPGADVFVVQDGRIVAVPLPQDAVGIIWATAPGETKTVPGAVALTSCESGKPLGAGSYEVYARVLVFPDAGGTVESFGGPWPLEVQ